MALRLEGFLVSAGLVGADVGVQPRVGKKAEKNLQEVTVNCEDIATAGLHVKLAGWLS